LIRYLGTGEPRNLRSEKLKPVTLDVFKRENTSINSELES